MGSPNKDFTVQVRVQCEQGKFDPGLSIALCTLFRISGLELDPPFQVDVGSKYNTNFSCQIWIENPVINE